METEEFTKIVDELAEESVDQKSIARLLGLSFAECETEVIDRGPAFFQILETEIYRAKKSVEINIFSWAVDSTGWQIAKVLCSVAENLRVVTVKIDVLGALLVGGKGVIMRYWPRFLKAAITHNLSLRDLNNLRKDPSVIHEWEDEKLKKFEEALFSVADTELLLKINPALKLFQDNPHIDLVFERNKLSEMDHSKVFIFDGTKVFLGGMNVGDDYSGGYDEVNGGWFGNTKPGYWKDYMVVLSGEIVSAVKKMYFFNELAENSEDFYPLEVNKSNVALLHNEQGFAPDLDNKKITAAIFLLLSIAKKEVIVEHAYIMDLFVIERLNRLADRGVKVVILKGKPESEEIARANEKFMSKLSSDIKIVPSGQILHSKFIMVDAKYSIVGSANLTQESLYYHEELSVMVVGDNYFQRQLQLHADYIRESAGLKKYQRKRRGLGKRIFKRKRKKV